MNRRDLTTLLGGAATWPDTAGAQRVCGSKSWDKGSLNGSEPVL